MGPRLPDIRFFFSIFARYALKAKYYEIKDLSTLAEFSM